MFKDCCASWAFSKGALCGTRGIEPFLELLANFNMTEFFEEVNWHREEVPKSCVMSALKAEGPPLACSSAVSYFRAHSSGPWHCGIQTGFHHMPF